MSKEQESLKTEIYGLLKSRGLNPISKESSGDTVPIPEEADVFEFMFSKDGKDYGKVWVTLDGLRQLIVYFGKDVADSPKNGSEDSNSWSQLHRALSRFATSRQLSFELSDQSNLEADMAKREHTKREEQVNEGYYPISKTASGNNNIPSVTMRIQHTRTIEEGEQRYRNIARIFVENQDGERILLPTTKPGLARTYVRHIAEGGKPNDERWNHLNNLCEEYQKMAGFVRATRNGQFNESAQSLVNEGINHYQKLRETLGKLQGKRGYNAYFESYTPALMEDEEQVDLSEMFMSSSLDPRIESVMPILSKLSKNITETTDMAETIALEEWADNLMDSTVKPTKQSDDYEDPEEFDYDSPEWQQTEKNASKFMSDAKKREVMKRMHGILSKGKDQGMGEGIALKSNMPPGLASATNPQADDTSSGWQGSDWDPDQDDVEHLTFQTRQQTIEKPGMKPTTTTDTQNISSKNGITSTHNVDVDESLARLKELAGAQTHPVQDRRNQMVQISPVQNHGDIEGTELATAHPVPNRNDIQGSELNDVGTRTYPVQDHGDIEVGPIPLSPLGSGQVNPHPSVKSVDLTPQKDKFNSRPSPDIGPHPQPVRVDVRGYGPEPDEFGRQHNGSHESDIEIEEDDAGDFGIGPGGPRQPAGPIGTGPESIPNTGAPDVSLLVLKTIVGISLDTARTILNTHKLSEIKDVADISDINIGKTTARRLGDSNATKIINILNAKLIL